MLLEKATEGRGEGEREVEDEGTERWRKEQRTAAEGRLRNGRSEERRKGREGGGT